MDQQAAMWARVKEGAKKWKQKWRVGDLLAGERCSPAVLDFLRSTHGPTGGGKLDSGEEAEEAGADDDADGVDEQAEGAAIGQTGPGYHSAPPLSS